MVDIFFYLFENYGGIAQCPDALTLARRLANEGFEEQEVRSAILWVEQLRTPLNIVQVAGMAAFSQRIYHVSERSQIGDANLAMLDSLVHAGSIDEKQREIIIERCLMLPIQAMGQPESFKALLLTILWADNQEINDVLLHGLMDEVEGETQH
ncbi:DUF494 family protein [Hydromonas duriensis]|uniref:DUF494 family protein n=1 Tax=Hydromonas duriensis TaxID=1527608 RepID=UPI0013C2E02B|nr:DUF494 family protein [Hydromonas duriensis]